MKIIYKIRFPLIAIAVVIVFSSICKPVNASDRIPLLEAVESARSKGISDEILNLLLVYSVDNALGPEYTGRVIQLLIRIQKAGIALAPFQDKIREGAAKHVDPQNLENALNLLLEDFRFVDSLMKGRPSESEMSPEEVQLLCVKSLDLGLDRQELKELFKKNSTVPPEMLAVASLNKAYLRQMAFDSALIDEILSTGLSGHNLTNQWSSFHRLVAASRRKGLSDNQVSQAAIDALKQNGDLRQVLSKLKFVLRDVRHGPHQEPLEDGTEEH
jgi:hypothetical protein